MINFLGSDFVKITRSYLQHGGDWLEHAGREGKIEQPVGVTFLHSRHLLHTEFLIHFSILSQFLTWFSISKSLWVS